jgi:hypothetical protein
VLTLPHPQSIFAQFFGGDAAMSNELESLAPDVLKTLRQTKTWQRLFTEPTLLWMP